MLRMAFSGDSGANRAEEMELCHPSQVPLQLHQYRTFAGFLQPAIRPLQVSAV